MRLAFASDLAETDEGVHLVLVPAHGLGHRGDLGYVRIGRDIEQLVIGPQPPQQAIQDCKALDVAMQDRGLRQFNESGGNVEGAVRRFERRCGGRCE